MCGSCESSRMFASNHLAFRALLAKTFFNKTLMEREQHLDGRICFLSYSWVLRGLGLLGDMSCQRICFFDVPGSQDRTTRVLYKGPGDRGEADSLSGRQSRGNRGSAQESFYRNAISKGSGHALWHASQPLSFVMTGRGQIVERQSR